MDMQIHDVLNRKQRQKNADAILNAIGPEEQDFNVMLLGFMDIIQASFYAYMKSTTSTQGELNGKHERINTMVNQILEGFNQSSLDNVEDMIVLTTCMTECINRALIRQQQNGVSINPELRPGT